jgi:hypothetical protein
LKRGANEIGWPAHRGWQVPEDLLFKQRHDRKTGRRLGARGRCEFGKAQSCRPCLGQGCRRGALKARKLFDAVEVAKRGGERLCDRRFQCIRIDGLKETAGQAGGEAFDRQGLQTMAARCGGMGSFMTPGEAKMVMTVSRTQSNLYPRIIQISTLLFTGLREAHKGVAASTIIRRATLPSGSALIDTIGYNIW